MSYLDNIQNIFKCKILKYIFGCKKIITSKSRSLKWVSLGSNEGVSRAAFLIGIVANPIFALDVAVKMWDDVCSGIISVFLNFVIQ